MSEANEFREALRNLVYAIDAYRRGDSGKSGAMVNIATEAAKALLARPEPHSDHASNAAAWHRLADSIAYILEVEPGSISEMGTGIAIAIQLLRDRIQALESPRITREEAEQNDLQLVDGYRMENALRNCMMLANRRLHRGAVEQADWESILRFCAEAGIRPSPLRDATGVSDEPR